MKSKLRTAIFYLRICPINSIIELDLLRRKILGEIVTVLDYGFGTAKDHNSGWVEIKARPGTDIVAVRAMLASVSFAWEVPEIIEIDVGEGKVQARQLPLFVGIS